MVWFKQTVRIVLETVFLIWGIFSCCTFLYAGYRVMSLLRNMSGILLQKDVGPTQYKGMSVHLSLCFKYNYEVNKNYVGALKNISVTQSFIKHDFKPQSYSFVCTGTKLAEVLQYRHSPIILNSTININD